MKAAFVAPLAALAVLLLAAHTAHAGRSLSGEEPVVTEKVFFDITIGGRGEGRGRGEGGLK